MKTSPVITLVACIASASAFAPSTLQNAALHSLRFLFLSQRSNFHGTKPKQQLQQRPHRLRRAGLNFQRRKEGSLSASVSLKWTYLHQSLTRMITEPAERRISLRMDNFRRNHMYQLA